MNLQVIKLCFVASVELLLLFACDDVDNKLWGCRLWWNWLCYYVLLFFLVMWCDVVINFVDNAMLQEKFSDDELPLFIGNNGDIGLCLCDEWWMSLCDVMLHVSSHMHCIFCDILDWKTATKTYALALMATCDEGLCLVDDSINWQFCDGGWSPVGTTCMCIKISCCISLLHIWVAVLINCCHCITLMIILWLFVVWIICEAVIYII